jgi:hypothetical protein
MTTSINGGCSCKAIRYEATAEPIAMVNCHCRDCQRATGAGYAAFVVFPRQSLRIQGTPRFHTTTGKSGKQVERGFCETCGSPVVTTIERLPTAMMVQAGSLDDPSRYKPTADLFVESAWGWDTLAADTKKFAEGRS